MNRLRLIKIGSELYGKHGWKTKLAKALERDASSLRRWLAENKVPELASFKIETLYSERKAK